MGYNRIYIFGGIFVIIVLVVIFGFTFYSRSNTADNTETKFACGTTKNMDKQGGVVEVYLDEENEDMLDICKELEDEINEFYPSISLKRRFCNSVDECPQVIFNKKVMNHNFTFYNVIEFIEQGML